MTVPPRYTVEKTRRFDHRHTLVTVVDDRLRYHHLVVSDEAAAAGRAHELILAMLDAIPERPPDTP